MRDSGCQMMGLQAIEEELAETRRNLIHASRLALAGQLLNSILHEVQQPLIGVLMHARHGIAMLDRDALPPAAMRATLGDIEQSVVFATETINLLRKFSDKRSFAPRTLDLNEVIIEILRVAEIHAQARGVSLTAELDDALPPITGDRIALQHVVLDLVINGMEAAQAREPARVTVYTLRTDRAVRIAVTDTGPGVPPENRERMFEPFFTTKAEGSGLGLTIVSSIVDAHGGTIWLDDTPGQGAAFIVEFPLPPA